LDSQLLHLTVIVFSYMHLAGSDLALHSLNPKSGEYTTEWNTTGIDPSKQATRQDLHLTLQVERGGRG
jgi:hypothetical protein